MNEGRTGAGHFAGSHHHGKHPHGKRIAAPAQPPAQDRGPRQWGNSNG